VLVFCELGERGVLWKGATARLASVKCTKFGGALNSKGFLSGDLGEAEKREKRCITYVSLNLLAC
jgi:hypothetical protein